MTLPQGFKTFTDGTVLTADEINGYLQQGILVFDNAAERTTALTGNLREGQYSYLKSDKTTYLYNGTAWVRVGREDIEFTTVAARDAAIPTPFDGQFAYVSGIATTFKYVTNAWVKVGPNVETDKNFLAFTGSGGTTVPAWATKMYYLVVAGGNTGSAQATGGAGGQVLQGNTAVSGGTSLTITVGGAGANSALAVSGGSTFTATGGGGAAGGSGASTPATQGTAPSAPFNVGRFAGGGGGNNFPSGDLASAEAERGGRPATTGTGAGAGDVNSGGGGGAGRGSGAGTGGSGIVLLYFS